MATDTDDNPDRRRAPRYAWVQPIAWETGTGLTGNMSTTGLFFKTDVPLLLNISLTFLLLGETFLLVGNTPRKRANRIFTARGKSFTFGLTKGSGESV